MAAPLANDPEPHYDVLTRQDFLDLYRIIRTAGDALTAVADGLRNDVLRANTEQVITVSGQPVTLSRNGRRHNLIWVAAAVNCLIDNTAGGYGNFTLTAGWNPVDLCEGARIITNGVPFSMLYRCSDFDVPGAIL